MMVALAPSDPRNELVMLRTPSYAMSAKRFTMPMIRTNLTADFARCVRLFFVMAGSVSVMSEVALLIVFLDGVSWAGGFYW